MSNIRSRSGNVFHYSAYWGMYSRVLFHDAGGPAMFAPRKQLGIPASIRTIEINLTAINPTHREYWEDRVRPGVIRAHCTSLESKDRIFGSLPAEALEMMQAWLAPETIELLLHYDYLPEINMNALHSSGGTSITNALKLPMSRMAYMDKMKALQTAEAAEMHPINVHTIDEPYREYIAMELARQAKVTPNLPLIK